MNVFSKKSLRRAKGFTLIELLVVLGILGIMAAALLVVVDPFEQIRKSQDSDMKNLAVEFLNANVRYYTTHNALAWFSVANGGVNCYTSNTFSAVALSSFVGNTGCLQVMVNEGELKQGFLTASQLSSVYATNPNPQTGNTTDVAVCFQPTSKSQQKESDTMYNQDGSTATAGTCKSAGGNTNCFWCAQ